jgi:hypothetical protein
VNGYILVFKGETVPEIGIISEQHKNIRVSAYSQISKDPTRE